MLQGLLQVPLLQRQLHLLAALKLLLQLQASRLRLQLCAPLQHDLELNLPSCSVHGHGFFAPSRAA